MTSNRTLFSYLSFLNSQPFITLTYGSQIPICGIGQTHPLPNLSFNFVLFVYGYTVNLIPISKLTHTLDYSVLFVNNFVPV